MCLNETCSKYRIGKYLSDAFCIKNGQKRDDLEPLLFNTPSEHAIRKVQKKIRKDLN